MEGGAGKEEQTGRTMQAQPAAGSLDTVADSAHQVSSVCTGL